MQQKDYLTELLKFQGFFVKGKKIEKEGDVEKVILYLERKEKVYTCSSCGKKVSSKHSCWMQEVKHLPVFKYQTILRFEKVKVRCPNCGIKIERLNFLDKHGRVTKELSHQVSELCKVMTTKDVAIFEGLNWKTVKEIDKRAIERAQRRRNLDGISTLGIDEIAVGKGHKYLHMISSLDGPNGCEVLYVGDGRKEENLEPFWDWFKIYRAEKITHAVMDMWKGFIKSFRKHCPNIRIIYDKFHIIRHLLNALNEIRKAEFKKAGGEMKGLLCGKKFILLSNMKNLRKEAKTSLKELLQINSRLYKAYLLKECFGRLWSYTYKGSFLKFWKNWKNQLKWSRLEPYKKFAKMIDKHLDGIIEC